jgi:hypothetical protein
MGTVSASPVLVEQGEATRMRDTSQKAWFLIEPKRGPKQEKALAFIKQFPDHTYGELGKISGMGENFRKRGSELEKQGVIYSSGKKWVDGRECHIWRASA